MHIEPNINKSAQFGSLKFPVRQDYVDYFFTHGIVKNENEIWTNTNYVSIIHRHWHGEGRNGCIFALLAARRANELGWQDYVITNDIDSIEQDNISTIINSKIQEAIQNPDCEVLSLLFSKITTDIQIARLIINLLKTQSIELYDKEEIESWVILSLRVPLDHADILSWLMAFGPFSYFPQTRQSPITEIAIRVKPKPEIQFHRLNNDYNAAHLADLPVDYKDEVMEKTWQNTLRRTRLILGEEPNHFSAAKTTITLPKNIWHSL